MSRSRALYIRNFVFGVEDSLVSTVGLLSGIATGQVPHATILLTGVIYIFVEGFSMAVGSFLSEESVEEYAAKGNVPDRLPILGSVVMFISFVAVGFIPIVPYMLWQGSVAVTISIVLSLFVLFLLGFIHGKISHINAASRAVRMALLGGLAIVIGVLVGNFFSIN
ncbi:MAG TPA: VIT1/CCC1 transporter family protein [Candidatus Paceibacterota bacterium]